MGIAFFDEQKKSGAVGEAAVRLEILLIVIIVCISPINLSLPFTRHRLPFEG
jgi:hypothetical protein